MAIVDEAGVAWQAEADQRWADAGFALDAGYVAPDFPEWPRPTFVRREVFGRFVLDREHEIVHDLATATPRCRIDAIASASFVHFGHELVDAAPDAAPCGECIEV